MVVTDLDGTLLDSSSRLASTDRETLRDLGREGRIRVVATGRSLYSAEKVLPPETPIDFLVFSSGAGILDWRTRDLVKAHSMTAEQVRAGVACLSARGLDFMIHAPVPANHRFWYRRMTAENRDFERRIERYRGHAEPWDESAYEPGPVSQLLGVLPAWDAEHFRAITEELEDLNVVRTTSPLDGRSLWIEIFPRHVSKAAAADWIASSNARSRDEVLVLGNDYNDAALLAWGGTPYVVGNAAPGLTERYPVVNSNERCGFSDAVRRWRRSRGTGRDAPPVGGAP